MSETIRIAMWSGPRNLSTAMMRSFGSRDDTLCIDEPFYAAYLALTGLGHPMRVEILRAHPTDPDAIARTLADDPVGAPIFYQKHMTHHMVDGVPRDWTARVQNVFLIRHPARVLVSYARKMDEVSLGAIGFSQQFELFEREAQRLGHAPVVIDGDDVLHNPPAAIAALCDAIGISYDPAMLSWAPGRKPEDGAWAPHWYDAVWRSTGFAAPSGPPPRVADGLAPICEQALRLYEQMAGFKIVA